MKIAQELIRIHNPRADKLIIEDVRIGLGYTAVLLDDGSAGAAFTFRDDIIHEDWALIGKSPLAGRSASELLALLVSGRPLPAALGLATANAISNRTSPDFEYGDILAHINLNAEDKIGMVGYFWPMMKQLKTLVNHILVFEKSERSPLPGDMIRSAAEAFEILPECDVAIITATALINGTLDELLQAASSCREVIVLGASTPLCPQAFTDSPVTWLSGVVVESPDKLLRIVGEGGGMRRFKTAARKVNIRINVKDA